MVTVQSIDLITTDPAVRNGRPCLAGTGLRVTDLVIAYLFHNRTPEELASDYQLPMAHVHAALAYYYQHKEVLDEDIRHQTLRARNLKEKLSSDQPSLLPR